MPVQYRIAANDDMELLMQSRMETLRAVNRLGDGYSFSDALIESSRKYFREGDQTTVLALEDGRAIGCATVCYITVMPTFAHPSGKRAHLMNVYTRPDRRREGIGQHMVSMLVEEAWRRGATEISLDATEAGRPLYRKLGFADSGECMVLKRRDP